MSIVDMMTGPELRLGHGLKIVCTREQALWPVLARWARHAHHRTVDPDLSGMQPATSAATPMNLSESNETSEKLDHTLKAYGRLERKLYELRRENRRLRHALGLRSLCSPPTPAEMKLDPVVREAGAVVVFCCHSDRRWQGQWPDANLICDRCAQANASL
jgi:hypothetical protein